MNEPSILHNIPQSERYVPASRRWLSREGRYGRGRKRPLWVGTLPAR